MQSNFNANEEKQNTFARFLLSVLRVLLIIGLLFYVLYHLTNGFSAEMKTETARLYGEERLIVAEGAVVRCETEVKHDGGGVVSYRYANGERTSKGARIAMVYNTGENANTVARIAELDRMIDLLDAADIDSDTQVSDAIAAGREISKRLMNFSYGVSRGDFGVSAEETYPLLRAFVKRDTIISDTGESVSDTLLLLEAERKELASGLTGGSSSLYAPVSGYFYDSTDGGEGVFDYDRILTLTPSGYYECVGKISSEGIGHAGKIVELARWYFVCPVSKEESLGLKTGKRYDLVYGLSDIRIKMTLDAKNEEGDSVLLVFSSMEMPKDFEYERLQKVSIVRDTVSGYRVPSSALRIVDGTVGVYIRSGNTVKFRVAEVIYESGAYSFISPSSEGKTLYANDTDESNDIYCKGLSLYDNVIVSGARELFPDRIVK